VISFNNDKVNAGLQLTMGSGNEGPTPGLRKYLSRVKPNRGLQAHTSEAAPVCAAHVPAQDF